MLVAAAVEHQPPVGRGFASGHESGMTGNAVTVTGDVGHTHDASNETGSSVLKATQQTCSGNASRRWELIVMTSC